MFFSHIWADRWLADFGLLAGLVEEKKDRTVYRLPKVGAITTFWSLITIIHLSTETAGFFFGMSHSPISPSIILEGFHYSFFFFWVCLNQFGQFGQFGHGQDSQAERSVGG